MIDLSDIICFICIYSIEGLTHMIYFRLVTLLLACWKV